MFPFLLYTYLFILCTRLGYVAFSFNTFALYLCICAVVHQIQAQFHISVVMMSGEVCESIFHVFH